MKYQALILVVLLSLVLGDVSTSRINKLSEIFNRLPRDPQKCFEIFDQARLGCINVTAEVMGVTPDELEHSVPGTKLYCCGTWDVGDCMLAISKVSRLNFL